jgi:hypothetical protein
MDLTQFLQLETATTGHKLQGKSVNELVCGMVQGEVGVFFKSNTGWPLPGETIPSDIDFSPIDYLEMMEGYETIFWLNP